MISAGSRSTLAFRANERVSGPAAAGPGSLWRLHSDGVNAELLRRWLRSQPEGAALKTDLYDETLTDGLLPVLAELFGTVVGVDLDPEVVEAARSRGRGIDARVADVRALPFDDGSFDAIASNSTLDHFDDREAVLAALVELRRVLRPAGSLVVTLDNAANPLIALRNRMPERMARGARGGFPYTAGWTTDRRGLGRLVAEAGMRLEASAAIHHAPRALLARSRRPAGPGSRRLAAARSLEGLGRLPSRDLSAHFVAALATRTD